MNKTTIYSAIQIQAISDILNQSDINFYRRVCRWYSKEFHTPLHTVMEGKLVQWDEMLLHYYESQMEDAGFNQVFDMAVREYIPELAEEYEEENQEFADALIAEQERTLAAREAKNKTESENSVKKTEETNNIIPPAPINMSFEDEDL